MGALRAKMERDLVVRGLGERTGRGYLGAVARLARHYGRTPDTLAVPEIEAYLVHLRQARDLTWDSLATVVTGLRFFYEVTLGRSRGQFHPRPEAGPPTARRAPPPGSGPPARADCGYAETAD